MARKSDGVITSKSDIGGSYTSVRGRRCIAASKAARQRRFGAAFNLCVSNAMISTSYRSQNINIIRIIGYSITLGCDKPPDSCRSAAKYPPLDLWGGGACCATPHTYRYHPPTLPTPPRHHAPKIFRKNVTGVNDGTQCDQRAGKPIHHAG